MPLVHVVFSYSSYNAVDAAMDNYEISSEEMKDALKQFRKAESLKQPLRAKFDFEDNKFRLSYVYKYFTSHVYCVKEIFMIIKFNEYFIEWLNSAVDAKKPINLCVIGGGSSSAACGFYEFLREMEMEMDLCGANLDTGTNWIMETTAILVSYESFYDVDGVNEIKHLDFDFFKTPIEKEVSDAVEAAEIVIISKFLSFLGGDRTDCEKRLKELLCLVTKGSFVLFVDDNKGGYFELMEAAANSASLTGIDEVKNEEIIVSPWDFSYINSKRHFDSKPETSTVVSASLWMKN